MPGTPPPTSSSAGQAPLSARRVTATQLTDGYNDALRKREPPYLLPLTPDALPAIERRIFAGSYKGVTDLVTLYAWPRPARAVTRLCANTGITPNQVTSASLLLVLAAMALFWTGHYGWGLLAAWVMTFLDTVDGKLARCTITSSKWGHILDHGMDLIHPPFWWWAWAVGLTHWGLALSGAEFTWVMIAIFGGYIVQRLIEGEFIRRYGGIHIHVWEKIDSDFRLITARRNPNMVILFVATLCQRPDIGLIAVAWWTVLSCLFHAVRLVQAMVRQARGEAITSWLTV